MPVRPLGQKSAGEEAERATTRDDQREDAHRLRPLGGLLELGDDDRDDHAGRQRGAETLEEAADDQVLPCRSKAGPDRGDGEEEHAGQEHLLAADQVAQAAGYQKEAAESDQVGVDDPGQVGL